MKSGVKEERTKRRRIKVGNGGEEQKMISRVREERRKGKGEREIGIEEKRREGMKRSKEEKRK